MFKRSCALNIFRSFNLNLIKNQTKHWPWERLLSHFAFPPFFPWSPHFFFHLHLLSIFDVPSLKLCTGIMKTIKNQSLTWGADILLKEIFELKSKIQYIVRAVRWVNTEVKHIWGTLMSISNFWNLWGKHEVYRQGRVSSTTTTTIATQNHIRKKDAVMTTG